MKALKILKEWNNGNYPSKNEILEAIAELEALENKDTEIMTREEARRLIDKHSKKDEFGVGVVSKKVAYIIADYLTDKEESLRDKKYVVYQGDGFAPAVEIASFEDNDKAEAYRDKAENESIKHDEFTCFFIKEK